MSTLDAAAPPALADTAAPAGGVVRFLGDGRAYWRLLIRGGVLLMFTLGIYRFWLTTDIRRFLWSNTELAGDGFEYTGTARELLIGFLMALAILVPLYTVFFIIALGGGALGEMSGLLSFVLLTLLGHYAVYRARRYRLTRTIFRGVRFHQTGSAWRYAVCALFWWTLDRLDARPRLSGRASPGSNGSRCGTRSSATCRAASKAPPRSYFCAALCSGFCSWCR